MRKIFGIISLVMCLMAVSYSAHAGKNQLRIIINKDDVDLENRTLNFRLNKDAAFAEIKVYDLDNNVLSEKMVSYDGARAGTQLSIQWPQIPGDQDNFRIELKATDINDFWVGFEIIHFYGEIPHEEVIFESGKWDILPSEAPKLDAVIPKIIEMVQKFQRFSSQMTYGLYVAGHTDTVGSTADNRLLSQRRAQAIAKYLMDNGLKQLKISISIRGFGEELLAVKTGDSVSEARNRRADYIISNFPPSMPGPGSWRKIK
ncbi:MAG: OmpA family protein [Deltaproteobacteria bacterium]|nr:OmpA family protein [Deltaproteobacteria bacterium]MBN2673482.1 OmpA family protein [Deltaproteobacteria bacterium]